MDCCQADGIEEIFDRKTAAKDLSRYRKKGPDRTTEILLEALRAEGVAGRTLLDIGGGVGAIQHELLESGASRVVSVDASSEYLRAAKEEANRQGHADQLIQHHGDFVEIAEGIPPADIVTLDRVICCYDRVEALVRLSTARAGSYYGVIYPHSHALVRILIWVENLFLRIRGRQFRAFAHETEAVDSLIRGAGFERQFSRETAWWHVHLYRRTTPSPA